MVDDERVCPLRRDVAAGDDDVVVAAAREARGVPRVEDLDLVTRQATTRNSGRPVASRRKTTPSGSR